MESKKYVDFDKVITTYKTFGHLNLHNVLEAFNEISAADVRPVVRAYWKSVPYKRARVCSRCEADEPYKFADDDANVYNFCPNCGADMRKIINE